MTRRLTVAAVGLVAAALLLAGFGGLVLARRAADRDAEAALLKQVQGLASIVGTSAQLPRFEPARQAIRDALDISGFDIVDLRTGPADDQLGGPAGAAAIGAGQSVAFRRGSEIVAVVPTPNGRFALVGSRSATRGFGPAGPWFLASSVVVLVAAALVARALARRLTGSLRTVEVVAGRLAAGDLAARAGPVGDDEIADLARSVDAMADSLEAAAGAQRSFLLSVSHDLRTPLTAIRGFGELLGDDADEEHARIGGRIEAEAKRLERLVGDLLDLATLDVRTPSLRLTDVDLVDVAEGVAGSLAPAADAAGLGVHVSAGGPVVVRGDADRLAQILANLVENALGFATRIVEIKVGVADGCGELAVLDDGPGIPADVLPHVFERLRTTRPRARSGVPGTGLGLAIAAELAQAMGGSAVAESPTTGGALVRVRIPLAPTPTPTPTPSRTP